jgi:uncharacterized protein
VLFALICTDLPGMAERRAATRTAHLDWIKGQGSTFKLAGPFLTPDGKEARGSLLILDAGDLAEARRIAREDPYAKAGIFKHVDVRPWSWTVGKP